MDFKFQKWRNRKQTGYDKDNITIKMAGKTINVFDWIQENREDTELIPTLEKYGCWEGHIPLDAAKTYQDFTEMKDLRSMLEQQKRAQEMFYNLDIDIRKKFNNNMYEFADKGGEWLKNEIDKQNVKVDTTSNNSEGGEQNG